MKFHFFTQNVPAIVGTCLALFAGSIFADEDPSIVFHDDFDDRFIGDPPGVPPWTHVSDGENSGTIQVIADGDDRFQKGSENQIVEWRKDGEGGAMALQALEIFEPEPENEVMTFSFDFIEAGAPGFSDWVSLFVYSGERLSSARAQRILIGRGSVGNAGYTPGTLVRADIIVNNSNNAVTHTFRGEEYTVLPGTFQTWFNGTLASSDFARDNNQRGPITDFELNTSTNDQVLAWFDDFTVRNEPFVRDIQVEVSPILFEDSFQHHAAGGPPGGPWTQVVADPETRGTVLVLEDEQEVFGKGPDNQFLEYKGDGDQDAMALRATNVFSGDAVPEVATFSFLLHEPDSEEHKDLMSLFVYAGNGAIASGNLAQRVLIGRGAVGTAEYEYGTLRQVDIIVNNSQEPVSYHEGEHTLDAGMVDVWFDGELVLSNFVHTHTVKGPIRSFQLQNSTNNTPLVYFDDFIVRGEAHVTVPDAAVGPYEEWLAQHFSEVERQDPAIGGDLADPDGDGLPNVLEFALGGDPRMASREVLPELGITTIGADDFLTLTYIRPEDAGDLEYRIDVADEPGSWNYNGDGTGETYTVTVEETPNPEDGTVTVVVRDTTAIAEQGRRFMRLSIPQLSE